MENDTPPTKRRKKLHTHQTNSSESNMPKSSGSCGKKGHFDSKKKLLVLDINGLLVDIVLDPCEGYKWDTYIGPKAVFKRQYCDEFLKFCFEKFNVGVWTSRTRQNMDRVLDFLMKDTRRQLLFCWDQSHCTQTGFKTIENSNKPLVLKELKKLWEKEDVNLPFDKGVYDESNTLLLDDSPYKALRNPPYTAIFPYTYSYRNTEDTGLGPEGDLRNYLQKLAKSDNVQIFIEENPFGQLPITHDNESWEFYQKIIRGPAGPSDYRCKEDVTAAVLADPVTNVTQYQRPKDPDNTAEQCHGVRHESSGNDGPNSSSETKDHEFPDMAKDDRTNHKVKDDINRKSKKKESSPVSKIKQTATPSNTRKSPQLESQTTPNPSPLNKKPIGPSPLRRSDRGKKLVSSKNNLKKQKTTTDSTLIAEDVVEDKENENMVSENGGRKTKRMTGHLYKSLFAHQQIIVESGGSWVPEPVAVSSETSIHALLKPSVSEICNVLKFSEDVKINVNKFLDFVLDSYHVNKEYTSILQAFMISLCWIGGAISNKEMDRNESFDIVKNHMDFSCTLEEAKSVYSKLQLAKEAFLQETVNLETENVDLSENHHESCNEEEVVNKCEEDVCRKNQEMIEKFNKEWDEKRENLENDYNLDQSLIRVLYNRSLRLDKLKILENEFANKMEEYQRLREIHRKDLEATFMGQVAADLPQPCVQPIPEIETEPFQIQHDDGQPDPLQEEVEGLHLVKDNVFKFHQETKQTLSSDCDKENAEMIAQIKLKYENKLKDAEAAFSLKNTKLESNINKVIMNKVLANAFRSKCQDLAPSGTQNAGQLHTFSSPWFMRHSVGPASTTPGQSSRSQQTSPPPPTSARPLQPPLQIVHEPAALFSSPAPPPSTTTLRPPSNTNNTPITPYNRPPPVINPIDVSVTNPRISNAPTWGPPPHMRPRASSEIRAPPPHMRSQGVSNGAHIRLIEANKSITQHVEVLTYQEKHRRLEQILRSQQPGSKMIIFCSTKTMCDQLARNLTRPFGAAAIHGDKNQSERDHVLSQFRSGKCPILVATDFAARGLDVKDIRVVVNYDFPTGVEDYVHQIGRTGRAGEAYTFFGDQDAKHASDLVKVLEGADQRVPSELRDMASRGGGGRSRRWSSDSGGVIGGSFGSNRDSERDSGGGGYQAKSFYETMSSARGRSPSLPKGGSGWGGNRACSRSPERFTPTRSFHQLMMEQAARPPTS